MTSSPPRGRYVKIPPKYSVPAKSGITVTITKGSNKNDFELKDD